MQMHATTAQGSPPRPGAGQVSVNCSRWEIYEERDAFARQWVIRGLQAPDDLTTIEVTVASDRIVTMIVEPGIPEGTPDVRARLAVDGQGPAQWVVVQHKPIPQRPGASIFAPVDLSGLKALLEALWQGAGMTLTIVAGEDEVIQAPLYNDPSFREAFQQVTGPA
jgi:hypothetical protein